MRRLGSTNGFAVSATDIPFVEATGDLVEMGEHQAVVIHFDRVERVRPIRANGHFQDVRVGRVRRLFGE